MRAPLLSSLLVSAAVVGFSAPVWAAGAGAPQVHVLELATDDADDQAKALTQALKARVKASKDYSLAEGDRSLAVESLSLKCGDIPDAACQVKIAEKLNAERYIWGTMKKGPAGQVTVELHFFQKGQPDVKQQFSYSENLTEPLDPSLQKLAEQMVTRITNFGKVGAARLSADVGGDAELFVDGASQGRFSGGQAELTLPTGDHKFEVRAGGKLLAQGSGKVTSTGSLDLKLGPPAKVEETAPVSTGGDWRKTAGYVGVGVGGAMIAGGLYAMLKVNSINNDDGYASYRKGFGPNADICQHAKSGDVVKGAPSPGEISDKCSTGSTMTTLQYVLFPVGAIAAGAGAYFLLSSGGKEESGAAQAARVQIIPAAGPKAGGVDVRVTF